MTSPGRVVYAGFATPRHSGGVHVMTEHVRMLRAAGHEAWLWLPVSGDAPAWMGTDLPVLTGATTDVGADDLLVLPEAPVVPGRDPAPGARKVVLNQNHFYTFAAGRPDPAGGAFPGWSPPPPVWAVSAESRDVLAAALPHLRVSLVPNAVDGSLFAPRPTDRARVTWFPRKRPREAALLRAVLAADDRTADLDVVELVDATRAEVAATLATTTVFVALGHSESFGLPVAEALAAGCLVAGYDGGGGHDLFTAPGAWAVPEQRPLLLRDRVLDLLARADSLGPVRAANRAWVLERHSPEVARTALLAAASAAFDGPGGRSVATHPAAWLDTLGPSFTAWA